VPAVDGALKVVGKEPLVATTAADIGFNGVNFPLSPTPDGHLATVFESVAPPVHVAVMENVCPAATVVEEIVLTLIVPGA
jgi:hypothetical protein